MLRDSQRSEVKGQAVLLTGASSGIGRELARVLGARGARLALVARRRPLLEELATETGGTAIEADLSVRGAAAEVAERARAALGRVDVLVNNAGGGVGGSQWAVADGDAAREAFEVNLWSPLALVGALVPAMRERARGTVVNVTSMSQVNTWPVFGAYAATKAALALATETLRLELTGSGVHVLEAIPGPVDTAVQAETRLVPGIERMLDRVPLGEPSEMARAIADGIETRRTRVIYPRRAGLAYLVPALARRDTRRLVARVVEETDTEIMEAMLSLNLRTGSMGDEAPRMAREAWEAERA